MLLTKGHCFPKGGQLHTTLPSGSQLMLPPLKSPYIRDPPPGCHQYYTIPCGFSHIHNFVNSTVDEKANRSKKWKLLFELKLRWTNSGNSGRLYFGGSKITADGDCSHEIKRCLLLGRKVITNLDSMLKSRDINLPTKVRRVKAMVFPVVMYGCESWIIKKAEC